MATYTQIPDNFWTDPMGKKFKELGRSSQVLAAYLINNKHSDWSGLYYLPIAYIQNDLGFSENEARETLSKLSSINYCRYDDEYEYVWVMEMGKIVLGNLKSSDKKVKNLNDHYEGVPDLFFINDFYLKYKDSFHLSQERKGLRRGFEGASEGASYIDKDIERDIDIDIDISYCSELVASQPISEPVAITQEEVFIKIPLVGKQKEFLVTEKMIREWSELYPGVDVKNQIRALVGWNIGNPEKRKTARGVLRHIHGWLSREQDRGGNYGSGIKLIKSAAERAREQRETEERESGFFGNVYDVTPEDA